MQQAVSEGFRLSPQQQHVWWAQRGEHSPAFVVQTRINITGPLDRARLARAMAAVAQRHEILRTTFPRLSGLDMPVQAIAGAAALDWRETSLAGLPPALREAALGRLCEDVREIPFDLTNGPLLRATLVALDGERCALLVTQPSLAADGPSLDLLAADVAAAYHGGLAGEALQYADLAEILHEWQGSPAEEPGPAFWREQDLSALVRVTTGPAGLPDGQPFQPRQVRRTLDRAAIAAAATRLGAPVWQLLLAGWQAAIHVTTGEEEMVVGVLFDGRTCEELLSALGPFARYLPVHGRAAADLTLTELGGALAATLADVARRQDFFSSESIERLLAQAGASGWPFGFDYQRPSAPPAGPGALRFTIDDGYLGLDRFGLRLSVFDDGRSLRADLVYDPALLGHDEAGRFLERLARVLDGLLAGSPLGEIAVLTTAERRELLALNRTARAVPAGLLGHQFFEERARRAPDTPAVIHAGRTWTYGELNARANRLAHWMRAAGLGPGSLVGLRLERSPELVAAVLGTLKVGAAYVPLDPGAPAERLAWMEKDAGLSLLWTRELLQPLLAGEISLEDGQDPPPAAAPADLAYVIYTSGSTGRPKGVMIPHRGLVNYLLWAQEAYEAGVGAGAPVHSAIGFDLTVTSLLVPLAAGTAVTLLDESRAVEALAAALRETAGFSLVKLTPAHLDGLNGDLDPTELAGRARALVIGGETLRGESLAPWRQHAPDTRLINEYGPTEATVGCCVHEIAPDDPPAGPMAIGHPIANARLHVVGRGLRRVPPGAPGELWIGGDGLARGYLGNPALTAERFVPDPFAGETGGMGERLYRTGDLVRRRPDGRLDLLGRIDDQLKIRGFRIEPGEIEAALAGHPQVRACMVLTRENERGKQLVACVVPREPAERPAAAELRRHLEERLPDYMVPALFAVLESLPLTPNGKVDRRALLASGLPEHEEAPYAPPRTLAEEVLAEVWMEVLGVSRVGIDDPFFNLGGDSIRSLQVIAMARKRGLAMTLQDLFQRPTIRRLAPAVRLDGAAPEPVPALAPFALLSPGERERLGPGIEDAYPLARLQAGMLFHSELIPASAIYHDLHSFHVRAPFDPGRMRAALGQVSLLHPVLRASFDLADFSEPLQLVHAGATVPLEIHDLPPGAPDEQDALLAEWLDGERRRGFDWTCPPLVAFHAHPRGEGSFQLTMSFHHAVLDGWSVASLLTDLFRRYARLLQGEEPPGDAPPEVAFRDFVALERAALASEEARSFWRRMLDGAEPARLPRLAPPDAGPAAVRDIHRPIDPALSDAAQRVARAAEVPLKSLLLALHLKVTGLLSGTRDVLTGLVSHGRPEHPDGERVLGLFLNTLPFRVRLHGGGSWRDLAQEVFALERGILPFRRFPFADMSALRGSGRLELEVVYSYHHFHVYRGTTGVEGIEVLGRYGYEETNFPLLVNLSLDPFTQRLQLRLSYRTADLDAGAAERLADHLLRALEAAVADPESPHDAPLLAAAERQQLLREWNDTAAALPEAATLHGLVAAQAARTPDAVAVELGDERWTYRRLIGGARRLARHLQELGVGPDAVVGLCAERSPEMIVGMLAVLEAGGAYLPLDPAYPAQRLAFMLDDSGARVLLVQEHLSERLPAAAPVTRVLLDDRWSAGGEAEEPLGVEVTPDNLAYVIYTSGSTGRPKGVMVPHRGACNRLLWAQEIHRLDERDAVLQKASIGFDFAVWECFAPLLAGARLVLAEPGRQGDGPYLVCVLREHHVTFVHFVPSLLAVFLREEDLATCASLRQVFTGGEALSPDLRDRLLARFPARLDNQYGPTEASIDVTRWACGPGQEPHRVPIGRPISNSRLYVVDPELYPVPSGVAGELLVGGAGLARGYLCRPDLTAERFVPDPFSGTPGGRLYRTGDLVRWLPDGSVDFLGRVDHQVKVRGVRIEPGEIEAALMALAGVSQAVVLLRDDTPGDPRLVAYLVGEAAAGELRQALRERLPDSMVPAAFVSLTALPLTPNGKVDRSALPAPEWRGPEESYVAPRTPAERALTEIWAETLGVERIGVQDSFFDRGGHSLSAVLLMARIQKRLGKTLPLAALFAAPTVEALAVLLDQPGGEAPGARRPLLVAIKPGGDRVPFVCVHPVGGNVLCYLDLARHLAPEQPFYALQAALQAPGGEPSSLEEMAARYVRELRRVWPRGPYRLGGWSMGGLIAFEMARQLADAGEQPELVALIDTLPPAPGPELAGEELVAGFARDLGELLGRDLGVPPERLRPLVGGETLAEALRQVHAAGLLPEEAGLAQIEPLFATFAANLRASRSYDPGPYPGRLTLWLAEQTLATAPDLPARWGPLALAGTETSTLEGDHYSMLRRPRVERLAGELTARLG